MCDFLEFLIFAPFVILAYPIVLVVDVFDYFKEKLFPRKRRYV